MNEDNVLNEIIELSKLDSKINEADTRFRIIDQIITDILEWPKDKAFLEVHTDENGKADYVLKGKNNKPLLVIEAKKKSEQFNLPSRAYTNKYYKRIKVSELLTDTVIKNAVLQCKEYCEDIGVDYGCITNGLVWIILYFRPPGTPWKTINAFVISDLLFFKENFTEAMNLLGYNAVSNESSLRREIGISRMESEELFYPKSGLVSYDMPVSKNSYSHIFSYLSKKFFDDIYLEYDFMESCYVTNRRFHEQLNSNVSSFVSDSLTPFFKRQGFQEIPNENNAGSFGKKIRAFSTNSKQSSLMILFGGRGSGKSTFLRKFLYHKPPEIIKDKTAICIVDLLKCSQDLEKLSDEIWMSLCKNLDFSNLLNKGRKELLLLYNREFLTFSKQFLSELDTNGEEYHIQVNRFLSDSKADVKLTAECLADYWKKKNKGIIIVIDNLDQLRPELQDICFLNSVEISSKLECLVITSMREERYYSVKGRGVLDAYHNNGFHLPSPVISSVIKRRVNYTLKQIQNSKDPLEEYNIPNENDLMNIYKILEVFLRNLSNSRSELKIFIENATHGDVRQALGYFKEFITSGYTNVDEISQNKHWTFSHHQVLKPMMIPERFFYDEKVSSIPNIFQMRDPSNGSHFTSIRLLRLINSYSGQQENSGFIDIKWIIGEMERRYYTGTESEKLTDIFLKKSLIESSNRLESYTSELDQVRLTAFGKYMLTSLSKRFVYLELIAVETGVRDSKIAEIIRENATQEVRFFLNGDFMKRLECRIKRTDAFLNYLKLQEEDEERQLGINEQSGRIIDDFIKEFNDEKQIILRSAKRKLNREKIIDNEQDYGYEL